MYHYSSYEVVDDEETYHAIEGDEAKNSMMKIIKMNKNT